MNRNEKLIAHCTSHLIAKRAIDSVILLIDLPPLALAALASPTINIIITGKKHPANSKAPVVYREGGRCASPNVQSKSLVPLLEYRHWLSNDEVRSG